MASTSTQPQQSQQLIKLAAALLLMVGGLAFVYAQYQKVQAPPPPERPAARNGAPAAPGEWSRENMPSREERNSMREQMFEQLDLSEDQRAQIDAIRAKYDGNDERESFRERMMEMREVLTPEQQDKAFDFMSNRFMARRMEATKVLPPEEQAKAYQKFEERRQEMRERFRNGEFPGPGGPGGFGGPGGPGGGAQQSGSN